MFSKRPKTTENIRRFTGIKNRETVEEKRVLPHSAKIHYENKGI